MTIIYDFFCSIKIIVYFQLITFFLATFFLPLKRKTNRVFYSIITYYTLTEVITVTLKLTIPEKNQRLFLNSINYELSFVITFLLWFFLLEQNGVNKKIMRFVYLFFLSFVLVDFLAIQKDNDLKTYIFCMGSFLYLIIFFILSFNKLKNEDFNFLLDNDFRLLCAPILMFFGLSLLFSFVNSEIGEIIIISNYNLYSIITDYINIVSYSIFLWYVYIEYRNHKRVISEEYH
ncbi:hypothetical protein [Flavobacterium sp.]|uniref:hypothetical protein n=1 Tax=Flavobacterium sp. TaxID=239 RepID=UPI00333EACE8